MSSPHPNPIRTEARATLILAAPLIGGQLAGVGMNFIDTVMAGKLNAQALAAIAVGGSVWATLMLTMTGVLMALPPTVAQLDGSRRRAEIAPAFWQSAWIATGLAAALIVVARNTEPLLAALRVEPEIVPVVLSYLSALCWGAPPLAGYLVLRFLSEGLGATRPTLYFGLLGLPLNVLANYLLIYGHWNFPRLGAVGCGYATATVWWAQLLGMLLYVGVHQRYADLNLWNRFCAPRLKEISELLKLGAPVGVAWFLETSMFTTAALLIGSLGVSEVAGHQVAINFAALTFMLPLGMSMAITVRVGNAVGRRDPATARRAALVGMGLAMLCQLGSASVMLFAPRWVAGMYTQDEAVIRVAVELLFLAAIFQLSDGVQVSSAGALRGLKDTLAPMLITVFAYWVVGLPLGYWMGFRLGWGAPGLWVGLIGGLTVAAALLGARLQRLLRRLSLA